MNTVINYASGKPSNSLRGYSYVHISKLRLPRQIAATMHKMLSITTAIAYDRLYLTVTGTPPRNFLRIRYKLTPISDRYKLKAVYKDILHKIA